MFNFEYFQMPEKKGHISILWLLGLHSDAEKNVMSLWTTVIGSLKIKNKIKNKSNVFWDSKLSVSLKGLEKEMFYFQFWR